MKDNLKRAYSYLCHLPVKGEAVIVLAQAMVEIKSVIESLPDEKKKEADNG